MFLREDRLSLLMVASSKPNVSPDLRIFSVVKKKLNNEVILHSLIMVFCISSGFCMETELLTNRKYCSKKWNRCTYGNRQMNLKSRRRIIASRLLILCDAFTQFMSFI